MEILRAFAVAAGGDGKSATVVAVAELVKMVPSTVSMGNAFFTDIGLLVKGDGGFIPSAELVSFNRACEWGSDAAGVKLAPLFERTWFAQQVIPKTRFRGSVSEEETLQDLADAAGASPQEKGKLRILIDFLVKAQMLEREGGMLKPNRGRPPAVEEVVEFVEPSGEDEKSPAPAAARSQAPASLASVGAGVISFNISVNVRMEELHGWEPARISAFFAGVAQVLAAKGQS